METLPAADSHLLLWIVTGAMGLISLLIGLVAYLSRLQISRMTKDIEFNEAKIENLTRDLAAMKGEDEGRFSTLETKMQTAEDEIERLRAPDQFTPSHGTKIPRRRG